MWRETTYPTFYHTSDKITYLTFYFPSFPSSFLSHPYLPSCSLPHPVSSRSFTSVSCCTYVLLLLPLIFFIISPDKSIPRYRPFFQIKLRSLRYYLTSFMLTSSNFHTVLRDYSQRKGSVSPKSVTYVEECTQKFSWSQKYIWNSRRPNHRLTIFMSII